MSAEDVTTEHTTDEELALVACVLRERAASLRAQAEHLSPPLAGAYRRRASELELEAWVADVQSNAPEDSAAARPRVLHPAA